MAQVTSSQGRPRSYGCRHCLPGLVSIPLALSRPWQSLRPQYRPLENAPPCDWLIVGAQIVITSFSSSPGSRLTPYSTATPYGAWSLTPPTPTLRHGYPHLTLLWCLSFRGP